MRGADEVLAAVVDRLAPVERTVVGRVVVRVEPEVLLCGETRVGEEVVPLVSVEERGAVLRSPQGDWYCPGTFCLTLALGWLLFARSELLPGKDLTAALGWAGLRPLVLAFASMVGL